jgi:trehalose 6-phosphate phosphatase
MVDVDTPPPFSRLPEPLVGALRELTRTKQLLVALDFDGTLAPEVDEPERARALPEAREAVLRLLDMPHTRVALVSGRSLASLERVSQLPDNALLIGSHGIEIRLDDPDDIIGLDAAELERVERLATEHNSRVAHLVARSEAAAELDGLTVRGGKNVLEFSVRSTTKGEAIEHLRSYTKATAVFFAGDDVTDEDGFAALGPDDVGLKAGSGTTLANYRVAGPKEIARALTLLADLRDGDVHEQ